MLDEQYVLVQSFRMIHNSLSIPANSNLRLRNVGRRVARARQYVINIRFIINKIKANLLLVIILIISLKYDYTIQI